MRRVCAQNTECYIACYADNSRQQPHLDGSLSEDVQAAEPASTSFIDNELKTSQHAEEAVSAPAPQPEKEV